MTLKIYSSFHFLNWILVEFPPQGKELNFRSLCNELHWHQLTLICRTIVGWVQMLENVRYYFQPAKISWNCSRELENVGNDDHNSAQHRETETKRKLGVISFSGNCKGNFSVCGFGGETHWYCAFAHCQFYSIILEKWKTKP